MIETLLLFAVLLFLFSCFLCGGSAVRSEPKGSRPKPTLTTTPKKLRSRKPRSKREPLSEAGGKALLEEKGWFVVRTINDESHSTCVYEALTSKGETIAVKQVDLPFLRSDVERRWYIERKIQLQNEISILGRLRHNHIVNYLGFYKTDETVDIWYEYIRGDSIMELYLENKFDRGKIPVYTRQILEALKYIHDNNVIHLDVSCCNILIDDKEVVKLAGFHFAQEIEENKAVPREKQLDDWVRWTAPEIMIPKRPFCGPASDIWALGCTVLEMATAAFPYSNMPWAVTEISKGKLPMMPDTLSNECREFIEICLQFNPLDRPTASQLLCHPFVAHAKTIISP